MTDHIKTWARRPGVQLWGIYLALVLLGAVSMLPIGYWTVSHQSELDRQAHEAAMQRASDVNKSLIAIINQRFPEITQKVDEAAKVALDAAQVANTAARAANDAAKEASGAGTSARSAAAATKAAASSVKEAAQDVKEAVAQPAPARKTAPDWLSGP